MTDEHIMQEKVTSWLLGELPPEEMAAVERHLQECDDCRRIADEHQATLETLYYAMESSAGTAERLDPERRKAVFQRAWYHRLTFTPAVWRQIQVAAVLVLVLGVTILALPYAYRSAKREPAMVQVQEATPDRPIPEEYVVSDYEMDDIAAVERDRAVPRPLVAAGALELREDAAPVSGLAAMEEPVVRQEQPLMAARARTSAPRNGVMGARREQREAERMDALAEVALPPMVEVVIDKAPPQVASRRSAAVEEAPALAAAAPEFAATEDGPVRPMTMGSVAPEERSAVTVATAREVAPAAPRAVAPRPGRFVPEVARRPAPRESSFIPVLAAGSHSVSTMPTDVDLRAYDAAMAHIREGRVPPAEVVHVDAFINAFDDGAMPPPGQPVAVMAEAAPHPLREESHVLSILVAAEPGRMVHEPSSLISLGPAIQVTFNSARVRTYRRIGDPPPAQVRRPARAAAGGQSAEEPYRLRALYEVTLVGHPDASLGTVSVRHHDGDGYADFHYLMTADALRPDMDQTSRTFRASVALAEWAEQLLNSPFADPGGTAVAVELLRQLAAESPDDARLQEAARLIRRVPAAR